MFTDFFNWFCDRFKIKKEEEEVKEQYIVCNTLLENCIDECSICLVKLNSQPCLKTKGCNHYFHYDCYRNYVLYKQKNGEKNIYCPYCNKEQNHIQQFINY